MKRKISLFLVLCMVMSLITALPITVSAASSGICGNNLTWTLDDEGTLTISGTGAMSNWDDGNKVPWYSIRGSIKTVIIQTGVTSIGNNAFCVCNGLTSISIPNSVTSIGKFAFYNCDSLTSISIPNSVTSIGGAAFYGCYSLTSITIPDSVTSIGGSAFCDCDSLTSISIPNSVTSIGDYAFYNCDGLTSVSIPNSVTSIGKFAFYNCDSLTSISIPNSVTYIGNAAFYGCYSLTSITIPDSVTSIGDGAFYDCDSLTSINVDADNQYFISLDGNLYNKNRTKLIQYARGKKDTSFLVPNSVTSIGDYAFYACDSLTSVSIPNSVSSIGDEAFYDCSKLKDVYYSGSQEQWKKISIDSGNDRLKNATIHYNFGKLPGDDGNTNNPAEISANTVHSLPAGINNNIKINKTGRGYAYFILQDANGNPYANRSYSYKIKGNNNTEYIGKTDINGIACVYTELMSLSGNKSVNKTCTVEFLNNDLLQKTFNMDLTLAPLSYKESWTGKATYGASIGAKLGAGGKVTTANGSLGAEAELASVGVSGKASKVITLENVYKDGVRDLHLSSSEDKNAAVNAKLGLYAGASTAAELSLGSVSGDVSQGYTLGKGFYIKNYNPSNAAQRQQIELFLLDTAMGLDGSNVIPRMLFNYWLDKNGMPTSNEQNAKVNLLFKSGASAPSIKFGDFSTSVAGVNADALYEFSKATDHENKTTTSTKTKVSADYKLFNTSYKASAKSNDLSIKTGSAVFSNRFINNSIQFSATNGSNGVEKISFKTAEDAKVSSVFTDKTSTEYYKNITYKNDSAKNLVLGNSFMQGIADGKFGFFGIKSAQSVSKDMTAGKFEAEYTREKEVSEEFGKTVSFGIDKTLGMEFGLTGIHKYSYTSQTGTIKNGYEYLKSDSNIDEAIKAHGEGLGETLDKIASGMKKDFSDALDSIAKSVKDGIDWIKIKINGTGDWFVSVTGFKRNKIELQSFAIMSVNDESETIENAAVSNTVGEPYVIEVKDADGNVIDDFGDNPLDLSLSFDKADFDTADVSFNNIMKQKIKIYRWNDENGVYVCIGGDVDSENNCVSTKISKPGQYILAIDNCPPSVTDFKVSDTGSTPTISANVSDMSGITDFSFKLDGKELVNSDEWGKYYNSASSTFSYKITDALEDNSEHTAEIIAGDSSGNMMENSAVLNFTVDSVPPVITDFEVPEISTTDTIKASVAAKDENLANVIAVVEYNGESFSYPMTDNGGIWTAEISGMPKFARLKITPKAYDKAGNCTTGETKDVIAANNETENIYIGILDYSDKNADIIINCMSGDKVNAVLEVNGFDKDNNLIETKKENIVLDNSYITKNVALDNDCYKIRAELLKSADSEAVICTGFSAYLNKDSEQDAPEYKVTLVDGDTKTVMGYDEFNSLSTPEKDGYTFLGWYLNSDFDPSLKVDTLSADYGSTVTLYGRFVKNTELIDAELDAKYEDGNTVMDLTFNTALTNGVAYAELFDYDANGNMVINKSTSQEIAEGAENATLTLPLNGDNKNHHIKISFYDNLEDKTQVGSVIERDIYAEKECLTYWGFKYYLTDDNKAEIVGYESLGEHLEFLPYFDGHEVVKICDGAFSGCKQVIDILLPDTVTEIGSGAFADCTSLQNVNYIGTEEQWNAIRIGENNDALTNAIKVFDYSDDIVEGEFSGINYTGTSVNGSIHLHYIFRNCTAVIEIRNYDNELEKSVMIDIPESITDKEFSIPFDADDDNHRIILSFIKSPDDKTEVGQGNWSYFDAEKPRYSDGNFTYTLVGDEAEILGYFGSDTTLTIPDKLDGHTVTRIGDYAAFRHNDIKAVTMPATITYIGERAFRGTNITEISLSKNLVHIGDGAFADTPLDSISIPSSVTEIGKYVFDYCSSLTSIDVDEASQSFCSVDGDLYSKDKTALIRYSIGKTATEWTIPDTVTVIKAGALADSECLSSITIPNSVKSIEEYALSGCPLSTITIPSSVTDIAETVFSYSGLTEITVDENNNSYCTDNGVLFTKDKTMLLQYPVGRTDPAYEVPDGVKIIAQESFAGSALQSVLLPVSLEKINAFAFGNSEKLDTVMYTGSKSNFENIDFTDDNDVISQAKTIIYGYDGTPVNINTVHAVYNSNKLITNVKFNHIDQTGTLHIAVYDNGRLTDIKETSITPDELNYAIEFDADDNYKNYTVKAFVWDNASIFKPIAKPVESKVLEEFVVNDVLETAHPYSENVDETKSYVYSGDCTSISVTFSKDTMTESDYDYIYIYDAKDNQIGKCSGSELAGQTITVNGNTVKIRLTSDGLGNEYGFKTERITVLK